MSGLSVLKGRRAGIILHPTSLPNTPGNGDLGPEAYHFVDFMVAAGASVWQMLPIGQPLVGGSPYQCLSVHAGNRWLISVDLLVKWGWLKEPGDHEQHESAYAYRDAMLRQARADFMQHASEKERAAWDAYIEGEKDWLKDYALFSALKQEYRGLGWQDWPYAQASRQASALRSARQRLDGEIQQVQFEQFVFARQWQALKQYANDKGVYLFGDMPIFVAHDSAEVWAERKYFKLDENGVMEVVAGVPPDYFSETGQRWGNPCYDWDALQADNFRWWKKRILHHLELFDLIRIDHFRGFESYWEIPAASETAIEGHWVKAPGQAFFKSLLKKQSDLPLVAEDLGLITDEVIELRDEFGFPGMRVFQFGFDGDPRNPHLPHNHVPNSVAYSGTHDNNTTLGWFQALNESGARMVTDYLGHSSDPMPWPVIRSVMTSSSLLAVLPFQDLLSLGSEHRMNSPGTTEGNWTWRFGWDQVHNDVAGRFHHLARMYNRLP